MERSERLKCSKVFMCGVGGEVPTKKISNSCQRQSKTTKFDLEVFSCLPRFEHNKALERIPE